MKRLRTVLLVSTALSALCAHGQATAPQTEEELNKQTALLKAQQAYYDQLALTTKSQQAAADASVAAQTTALTVATALETAQYTNDLALATALKGSGLTAATGKDGLIAIASADKSMLALQRDSLAIIEPLTKDVCDQLHTKLPVVNGVTPMAFIAPPNYEQLVEKSVVDITQLIQLRTAAEEGSAEFDTANMEVAATAAVGALVSAQYIAGGIQALTKLLRTDYNVTYTATNRQGLFEQSLGVACKDRVIGNLEARLRLNAAKLLRAWLPDMAKFSQRYEMVAERTTQRKAALTAQKTAVAALKPTTDKDKAGQQNTLTDIGTQLDALASREEKLAKYKTVAVAIKTYLSTMGTGTIYESLVWGQHLLHKSVGVPVSMQNLNVETLHRISYVLNVQDTSVKATSTFSADKVRYFATAEIYYSLVDPDGAPVSTGVMSMSTAPTELEIKSLKGAPYSKAY